MRRAALLLLGIFFAAGSANADLVLSGGGLTLVEEGGSIAPGNLAATGTAFAKDLLPGYPASHTIPGLNDQLPGNSKSWIGESIDTFAGISFGATPVPVSSIAFGRDNTGGFTDRTPGLYTLQYTTVPNPDASTTSWTTIGTLNYGPAGGTNFAFPSKRHRYAFNAVAATGIRLIVPSGGLATGTCIDELEAYSGIVVTTTADELNTPSGANISLREAVRDAVSGGIIVFAPALSGQTITLTTASEIAFGKNLTIDASSLPAGVIINGGTGSNRIFGISGGSVSMLGVTLTGGNGTGAVDNGRGGAVLFAGSLSMTRCSLAGNSAGDGGGAINIAYGATALTLTQCTLSGNSTGGSGGAILASGGVAQVTLTQCTLSGNSSRSQGGGICSFLASLTLNNTIIAGNSSVLGEANVFISGDIDNEVNYLRIGANIVGSFVNSGEVISSGPAAITAAPLLAPLGNYGGPTKTMPLLPGSPARNASVGSPITSDQRGFPIVGTADLGAYETQIGAIADQTINEDTNSGAIAFTVGTVGTLSATSGNTAVIANAGIVLGGSGANRSVTLTPVANASGTATITIADSLSGETQAFLVTVSPVNDAPSFTKGSDQVVGQDGPAQSAPGWATGFNPGPADEAGQSVFSYLVSNSNNALFSVQPAVGTNGTLTFTPAANASGVATVTVQVRDDGGTANGGVDTSAAQTFKITITPVVTTTADSGAGSLRAALASAAAINGANTIPFASNLSGQTITLGSEISLSDSAGVTLDASSLPAGITISGGGTSRIFFVQMFTPISITGVTFTGGNGLGADPGRGGAIFNRGVLTLTRCTLVGNSSTTQGGAIYSGSQANAPVITLTHCTFSGNTAGTGGAFVNDTASNATLRHCTFSGNNATGGGGIYTGFGSQMTLTNSIVAGNTAGNGPDIQRIGGTITPGGVSIIGNLAGSSIAAGTNVLETSPLVGPLGNYGGRTQTMALLPGSPARNAATVLSPAITSDQRGFPIVGTPDIGAYEAGTIKSFDTWAWETKGSLLDFNTDEESDGASNGLEYATRRDPMLSDTALAPEFLFNGGGHGFRFRYQKDATDLRYIVQRSADLGANSTWQEIYRLDTRTGQITENGVTGAENPSTGLIDITDPTASSRSFWRLLIEQAP